MFLDFDGYQVIHKVPEDSIWGKKTGPAKSRTALNVLRLLCGPQNVCQ